MSNSITHFQEKGIPDLELLTNSFLSTPTKHAEFIYGIAGVYLRAAAEYIGEVFTELNNAFRRSGKRRMEWVIVKDDTCTKTSFIGDVTYKKPERPAVFSASSASKR